MDFTSATSRLLSSLCSNDTRLLSSFQFKSSLVYGFSGTTSKISAFKFFAIFPATDFVLPVVNFEELSTIYRNGLKHEYEDIDKLKIIINPLLHMLSLLHLTLFNVADLREKDSTLDSIIYFINRNFMEKISLADIAVACSCSESTVSHIFKSHTGTSVGAYILNLRIEQSKKLLNTSSLSVTEIALVCGFDNSNYFSIAFKRICGVTPSEYRRKS